MNKPNPKVISRQERKESIVNNFILKLRTNESKLTHFLSLNERRNIICQMTNKPLCLFALTQTIFACVLVCLYFYIRKHSVFWILFTSTNDSCVCMTLWIQKNVKYKQTNTDANIDCINATSIAVYLSFWRFIFFLFVQKLIIPLVLPKIQNEITYNWLFSFFLIFLLL